MESCILRAIESCILRAIESGILRNRMFHMTLGRQVIVPPRRNLRDFCWLGLELALLCESDIVGFRTKKLLGTEGRVVDEMRRDASFHNLKMTPRQGGNRTAKRNLRDGPHIDYLYAFELPFSAQDRNGKQFKIVKVGASVAPGNRFASFRTGFNQKLLDTEGRVVDRMRSFQNITMPMKKAKPDVVLRESKKGDEYVFVIGFQATGDSSRDRRNAELWAQNILGTPVSRDFIDNLKRRVGESEEDRKKFETRVGWSEWVVCPEGTTRAVKEAYRNNELDSLNGQDGVWPAWTDFIIKLADVTRIAVHNIDVCIGEGRSVKLQMYAVGRRT